ncbi:hypothetical protein WDU94_007032 [Cyamophila willieti]
MFPNNIDKIAHMQEIEQCLAENPVSSKHRKIHCSHLKHLLGSPAQKSVGVEVSFGNVSNMATVYEKMITLVNETERIFEFTLLRTELAEKTEKNSHFQVEAEGQKKNFLLLPGEYHDVIVKFHCKLLNCYRFEYFQIHFKIIDELTTLRHEKERKFFEEYQQTSKRKHISSDLKSSSNFKTKSQTNENNETTRKHVIKNLEEVKLNIIPFQVFEDNDETNQDVKKSINLNLSGVCTSPTDLSHFEEFIKKIEDRAKSKDEEKEEVDFTASVETTSVEKEEKYIDEREVWDEHYLGLENLFDMNVEKYFTIQPKQLHMTKYFGRKQFVVKNMLNVTFFLIWNKDVLKNYTIEPASAFIKGLSSIAFKVEYKVDLEDIEQTFHVTELDCSVYYGNKTVEIDINQDKYKKRVIRLVHFLPYSFSIKLDAHNFSNGYSWIPKHGMNPEKFKFQFLLNEKQSRIAYSNLLLKNCGNLPLYYHIDSMQCKYYEFETNTNFNSIKNHQDFNIIHAILKLKNPTPEPVMNETFTFSRNTDLIYNESEAFEIYSEDRIEIIIPEQIMNERNIIIHDCRPVQLEEPQEDATNKDLPFKSNIVTAKSTQRSLHGGPIKPDVGSNKPDPIKPNPDTNKAVAKARKQPSAGDNPEVPNPEIADKPKDFNNYMEKYYLVSFPSLHPYCCERMKIPLYNPSQHTIRFEFEMQETDQKAPSHFVGKVFSLETTHGTLLSNQYVEITCSFRPIECKEYKQLIKCKQSCFVKGVEIPDLFFMLKGCSIESVITCKPSRIELNEVQSQFFIDKSFQIINTKPSKLNFLLRCIMESVKKPEVEPSNVLGHNIKSTISADHFKTNETVMKCPKSKQKKMTLSNESPFLYEDLVRLQANTTGKFSTKSKINVADHTAIDDKTVVEFGVPTDDNQINGMQYVDTLSCTKKKIFYDIQKDYIIIYPMISTLNDNETKTIKIQYHPFTRGTFRLTVKLFALETPLHESLELDYDETRSVDLLKLQYTCIDSYLQVLDTSLVLSGGSKCFTSFDYYFHCLKIPTLNEKFKIKGTMRLKHQFYLPSFEPGKEISFEVMLGNMTNAQNFNLVNISHGICNGCFSRNQNSETQNVRVCKHFEKYINIEPKLVEFDQGNRPKAMKLTVNYGSEEFVQYVHKYTGSNVTEYYTTFCFYVLNINHKMCIIKKYLHLSIKFNTIVTSKETCDAFILPLKVTHSPKISNENDDNFSRMMSDATAVEAGQGDSSKEKSLTRFKFYSYDFYRTEYYQPFWLYNNSSQHLQVFVKVDQIYCHLVRITQEKCPIKPQSKYPILFLIDTKDPLENFTFEMTDDATHVVRKITVTIHEAADPAEMHLPRLVNNSKSILSANPLVVPAIPLHHTTVRKLTLRNPYTESVLFNWDSTHINGVLKVDIQPKMGHLNPNECKQVDLIIQSLSYPTSKLELVLAVELYKEKYFVTYFETLTELSEVERQRCEIHQSGPGNAGGGYEKLNIDEYRLHAWPKPNVQTLGIEISSYDVLNTSENFATDFQMLKLNPKLSSQEIEYAEPSPELKLNKTLQGEIKRVFDNTLQYLLEKINSENTTFVVDTYEDMKTQSEHHPDVSATVTIENIFTTMFEDVLYQQSCPESATLIKHKHACPKRYDKECECNTNASRFKHQQNSTPAKSAPQFQYPQSKKFGPSFESVVCENSQHESRTRTEKNLSESVPKCRDNLDQSGNKISEKKISNLFDMNNDYYYEILTGENVEH